MSTVELIAAGLADRDELDVLHCGADFDLALDKTDLEFDGEWPMPRGSLS